MLVACAPLVQQSNLAICMPHAHTIIFWQAFAVSACAIHAYVHTRSDHDWDYQLFV